jgi:hypothetical protein
MSLLLRSVNTSIALCQNRIDFLVYKNLATGRPMHTQGTKYSKEEATEQV